MEAARTWSNARHVGPGDVVVDVGAGIGDEVAWLSGVVGPSGAVVAIEAHPATFACLQAFCILNGLANVELHQAAVVAERGRVAISDDESHVSNSINLGRGTIEVDAVPLDDLLPASRFPRIAFLKMNIEGAERFALPGMRDCLRRSDAVTIASHDFRADLGHGEFFRTRAMVVAYLQDLGLQVADPTPDPRAWVRDHVNAVRAIRDAG